MHRLVGDRQRMAGSKGTGRWLEMTDAMRRQDEAIDGLVFGLYGIDGDTGSAIRRDVPDAAARIGAAAQRRAAP